MILRLPPSVRLDTFDADMPAYGLSFPNLKSKIFFNRVSIVASKFLIIMDVRRPLTCQQVAILTPPKGLYANFISIRTSGASIIGTFYSSQLSLETTDELLQADVFLTNDGLNTSSKLDLHNRGGYALTNVLLFHES